MQHRASFVLLAALALPSLTFANAQEEMPAPATELKKLEGLIGHWQGSGTALMAPGSQPSKWTSQSTYAWSLGNHFVREDTIVAFSGMPQPMAFRCYYGWDREGGRYVNVMVSNSGEAKLVELQILADGTMLQFIPHQENGSNWIERARSKIDGDSMSMTIDFLMAEGPSAQIVTGSFERVDKVKATALDASAFEATPNEAMRKLARMAGTYSIDGNMVMMHGSPPMKITGTDKLSMLFGGNVLLTTTEGYAAGSTAKYEAENYFAWDPLRKCIVSVFVSNMGEVGSMESRFSEDGKSLISTTAATYMGQPCAQRYVLELDADGKLTKGSGHCLIGTTAPYQSFSATYTKK